MKSWFSISPTNDLSDNLNEYNLKFRSDSVEKVSNTVLKVDNIFILS